MSNHKIPSWIYRKTSMTRTDWLVDCVIAAGAFGFGMLQVTLSMNLFIPDDFTRRLLGVHSVVPNVDAVIGTLLICSPLIFRRRFPWITLVLTLGLWFAFSILDTTSTIPTIAPFVALFTVAYEMGRGQAIGAAVLSFLVIVEASFHSTTSPFDSLLLSQNVASIVAVTFAGYALNARQQVVEAAENRASDAERMRDLEARRAIEAERTRESEASRRVEEERVRIAREIHDITAHSLSAVSIQAAAVEKLIDTNPKAAHASILEVRQTAKSALSEMRAIVGVLRGGEDAEVAPTEGTDQMGTLVDFLEDAQIQCKLDMSDYDRSNVPLHVDVALFRIAREASTNIVRHSKAKHATITLCISNNAGELAIRDDGCGFDVKKYQTSDLDSGHGLQGMRERVNLLGGKFLLESDDAGTFISATIPIRDTNQH